MKTVTFRSKWECGECGSMIQKVETNRSAQNSARCPCGHTTDSLINRDVVEVA